MSSLIIETQLEGLNAFRAPARRPGEHMWEATSTPGEHEGKVKHLQLAQHGLAHGPRGQGEHTGASKIVVRAGVRGADRWQVNVGPAQLRGRGAHARVAWFPRRWGGTPAYRL
jgi:hypothetical protein